MNRVRDLCLTRLLWPLALILVTALSLALFTLCWRYDNKYTAPRPASAMGITRLELGWLEQHPRFYLVEGWEFYQNKLLTPEEITAYTPDARFYIGRFGGFDLGDPDASPYGDGTYRTTLLTDGVPRTYALELPVIFSRWRLWVNGELMQSVGSEADSLVHPANSMVTFAAGEKIEIVVAVTDDSHFYSGMVYPPAFGIPEAVANTLSARLVIHGAVCAVAILAGLLCLLLRTGGILRGIPEGQSRAGIALFILCLCVCGSTMWPILQALGRWEGFWPVLQRLCYYGIFLTLIWIQSLLCRLPRIAAWPAILAGAVVCGSVLLQPLFPVTRAGSLYAYSHALGLWKWLCAAWLLGTSLRALWQKKRYSKPLLAGSLVFGAALVVERVNSMYEPILLGWYVETAGFLLLGLVAGIIWWDTARLYQESLALREEKRLADFRLEAQGRHAALQREYVAAAREQLHETTNTFTLLRHYLEDGDLTGLGRCLDERLGTTGTAGSGQYTGNSLVDAMLSLQIARMEESDIYLEADLRPLPPALPLSDGDVTSLLMNLLDNAVEACRRIPDASKRWICLSVGMEEDSLVLRCENGRLGPPPERGTSKADKEAHGYGQSVLRRIAAGNGGSFTTEWGEDSYQARITLPTPLSTPQTAQK